MYQTIYDEPGLAGIGERCAALIERCAPRFMRAGGGGLHGVWREHCPILTERTKAAIRSDYAKALADRQHSSREILEGIATRYGLHYQTVCRITRDMGTRGPSVVALKTGQLCFCLRGSTYGGRCTIRRRARRMHLVNGQQLEFGLAVWAHERAA